MLPSGFLSLLVNVAACRECPVSGPGDHDAANGVVRVGLRHGIVQLVGKQEVHGVEHFRPVQRDYGDPVLLVHQDVFVGHEPLLKTRFRRSLP